MNLASHLGHLSGRHLVELDDWTHRQRRDHARDVLTRTAGYRTIRLPAAHRPTLRSVREAISDALT